MVTTERCTACNLDSNFNFAWKLKEKIGQCGSYDNTAITNYYMCMQPVKTVLSGMSFQAIIVTTNRTRILKTVTVLSS